MSSRTAEIIAASLVVLGLIGIAAPAPAQRIVDLGADTLRSSRVEAEAGDSQVELHVIDGTDTSRVVIRGKGRTYRSDEEDASILRTGESLTIEAGQIVDGDAVSIGGSVTVLGEVRGDVVAIGGNVTLKDGAVVEGDAVAIGGRIRKADTARIGGQQVGMNFIPAGIIHSGHDDGGFPVFSLVALIVIGLFLFLFGWLLHVVAESRVQVTSLFLAAHPWKSLFTGLAIILLAPAAVLILFVTVVGIPVGLLVMVLLPIAHAMGFLLVAAVAGNRLLSRGDGPGWGWIKSLAIGLGLFLGIVLFGAIFRAIGGFLSAFGWALTIFGWTVAFLAATVGLGALALSRVGRYATTEPVLPPAPPGHEFSAPVS